MAADRNILAQIGPEAPLKAAIVSAFGVILGILLISFDVIFGAALMTAPKIMAIAFMLLFIAIVHVHSVKTALVLHPDAVVYIGVLSRTEIPVREIATMGILRFRGASVQIHGKFSQQRINAGASPRDAVVFMDAVLRQCAEAGSQPSIHYAFNKWIVFYVMLIPLIVVGLAVLFIGFK